MIRRTRGRELAWRGQAMVEFALVAPLLFLLLFGISSSVSSSAGTSE
jgi:Flp pilus assembly protein TadG